MEIKEHSGTYFAAMNTAKGFRSYFYEIFGDLPTLYIIKGGPGTGKSRLMRSFAESARAKSYSVEEFLCSSDPTSLDGVIIPELGIGVLDGTLPHSYELHIPGARENIIDLGQFWDSNILKNRHSEITALNESKTRLYASVYAYLNAISCYDEMIRDMVQTALEEDKLSFAIKRAGYTLGNGNYEGAHKIRIRSSVSADGYITLNTYASKATKRYSVLDVCGSAGQFMQRLLKETDRRSNRAIVSYCPFRPTEPDAIYYPEKDTVYYLGSETDYDEKTVNMKRFIDDKKLRPYKPRIRALNRLKEATVKELRTDYSSIRRLHTELERLYAESMDFKAKEKFTEEFINKILSK